MDSDTCVVAPLHAQLGTVLFVTQLHASPGLVPPQGGIGVMAEAPVSKVP